MLKNKKIMFSTLTILLSLFIVGCQNNKLILNQSASTIEVYEWKSDNLIYTIDDVEIIENLINKLNKSRTKSTANIDFPSPDYKLYFKNDEQTVCVIGYFQQEMNLDGLKGRYWDSDEDIIFAVKLQLLKH